MTVKTMIHFYLHTLTIVATSTDLVADKSVNCGKAREIGHETVTATKNKAFIDIKLKQKDRLKAISDVANNNQDSVL